jgi:hypothetical protein
MNAGRTLRLSLARSMVLALAMALAHGARADEILDVQAGLLFDSNLPRAEYAHDVKSDTALQASVAWGRFIPLADGLGLRATIDAAGEVYAHYTGLNNVAAGGSLALRRKFGLGAFAPWISFSAAGARLDYHSRLRDGWRTELGVGAGRRLTQAWNVSTRFAYQHRTADENDAIVPGVSGDVFDLQSHQAGVTSEVSVTERLSLALGYDYRRGDVASTTLRNFAIFTHSDAIERDPVFGADTIGYRIFAITRAWRCGASYAVGVSGSINLTAERWVSRSRGGIDYFNTLVGLAYAHAL